MRDWVENALCELVAFWVPVGALVIFGACVAAPGIVLVLWWLYLAWRSIFEAAGLI